MALNKDEVNFRIQNFRNLLKLNDLEIAIISYPLHIFYFTGTFVKGILVISLSEVKLLVNRPLERAKKESFVPCEPLTSLKKLPQYIKKLGNFKKIGIENHNLNHDLFQKFKEILSDYHLKKIDSFIFDIRKIKSAYEIDCIIKAGKNLDKAFKKVLSQMKPGMKEIEASAILEKELRQRGHPGFTRSLFGFELSFGYLISGKEAIVPTHFITGQGGIGVPGFPGGASFKRLKVSEPILIDFSGYYEGYYIDQTRMASFKPVKEAKEFFKVSLEIIKTLEKEIKPGIISGEVYEKAFFITQKAGFQEYFMNHGENVKFVGHGVGLQIDEPPTLALNKKEILKENMVIALEPKFHVPNLGVIGIEDTFVITSKGLKRINTTPRKWLEIR